MKLKHSYLLYCSIKEVEEIYHFVTDYNPDAVNVQIDFKNKRIGVFSVDDQLVVYRDFENLF